MADKISILIPTRDNNRVLINCLAALERAIDHCKSFQYEVMVLDGSLDLASTKKWMQEFNLPNMSLVPVEQWWNFSQINNYGVTLATGTHFLYLNNDCYVAPDFFSKLGDPLPTDEMQGFLLCHLDGSIQHAGVVYAAGRPFHIAYRCPSAWYNPPTNKFYCPAVTFACALVPRRIHDEISGFDEQYSWAYEDADYSFRAWEHGFKVCVRNDITAIHETHASYHVFGAHGGADIDKNLKLFGVLWPGTRIMNVFNKANRAFAEELEKQVPDPAPGANGTKALLSGAKKRYKPKFSDINTPVPEKAQMLE